MTEVILALTGPLGDVPVEIPVAHELVHQDLLLLAGYHVDVQAEAEQAHEIPVVEGCDGADLQPGTRAYIGRGTGSMTSSTVS